MAVTLTVAQLSAAIRVGNSAEEVAEVTRLLAWATETVSKHLGTTYSSTPETIVNEAVIRLAGYQFDRPYASSLGLADVLRNSGAAAILLPYRIIDAGTTAKGVP